MRMYRIIVNGVHIKDTPAYRTPEEAQHEMVQELGGKAFVRVKEYVVPNPDEKTREAL